MYHTLEDGPTDDATSQQALKIEHHMVWQATQGAPVKKAGQNNAEMDYKHVASAASAKTWEGSHATVAWSCQWHELGLTPVRPQVILKTPISLQCMHIAG